MKELTFYTDPKILQRKTVEEKYLEPAHYLCADMGTGKTKITLDIAVNLHVKGSIACLIVVCPKALVLNWRDEIVKHINEHPLFTHYYSASKASTLRAKRARKELLSAGYDELKIVIINADSLITKCGHEFIDKLLCAHACLLTIDESGRILKNHKTQRAKKLLLLAPRAQYKLCLSGTPITKSPLDLWAQYRFLKPDIFNMRLFSEFQARYATLRLMSMGARMFPKVVGYKNLDELVAKVMPITTRIKLSDMTDLPPKLYKNVYYDLSGEQLTLYKNLQKDSVAFPGSPTSNEELVEKIMFGDIDRMSTNNALVKLLRLQQIISGYCKLDGVDKHVKLFGETYSNIKMNPRIQVLLDVLEMCERKVLIWCRFVEDIETISALLNSSQSKIDGRAVSYFGKLSESDREYALKQFKYDAEIRFLVANPACAGIGLTLIEADTAIYYSQDFSLEHRLQSEARCHRIGQQHPVNYISIVANNTVDEHINKCLLQKMQYSTMLDDFN